MTCLRTPCPDFSESTFMSPNASWSCCRDISSTADGGSFADSAAVITIETFSLVHPETSHHHSWVQKDRRQLVAPDRGVLYNMTTQFLISNMVPTAWRRPPVHLAPGGGAVRFFCINVDLFCLCRVLQVGRMFITLGLKPIRSWGRGELYGTTRPQC